MRFYLQNQYIGIIKEWRISCPFDNYDGSLTKETRFQEEAVRAIYLGCKMPEEKTNDFKKIKNDIYPNAKLFKARVDADKFELQFDEI